MYCLVIGCDLLALYHDNAGASDFRMGYYVGSSHAIETPERLRAAV